MRAVVIVVVLLLSVNDAAARRGKKRPPPARAAPAAAAPAAPGAAVSPAQKKAAQMHFAIAQQFFGQGKFGEAMQEYQAAYAAWPLDGFYFNIAQCQRNLGQNKEAIASFEKYLASPKADKNRAETEAAVAELKAKVAAESAPPETPKEEPKPAVAAVEPEKKPEEVKPVEPKPVEVVPVVTPAKQPERSTPIYKRTVFWVVVGAVLVVATVGIAVGASEANSLPSGSLGSADWR